MYIHAFIEGAMSLLFVEVLIGFIAIARYYKNQNNKKK